jgi:addiction module HigA family antidote
MPYWSIIKTTIRSNTHEPTTHPTQPRRSPKRRRFYREQAIHQKFSEQIGVTRAALSRVLNGRAAISPDMALRLADALGGSAESWLHMQANYDLWQARQKPRKAIARLEIHA